MGAGRHARIVDAPNAMTQRPACPGWMARFPGTR